jgi:hypothetical protein
MEALAATPRYSARMPSEKSVAPLVTSMMTVRDAQPLTGTLPMIFSTTIQIVSPAAIMLRRAPKSVISRNGRVPELRTIRQTCATSPRVEKPEGRSRSLRMATGTVALRPITQVSATSR